MACSYFIDTDRSLVVTTAEGAVTFAEVVDHQNALLSDTAFNPTFSHLVDAVDVTNVALTHEEAVLLANRDTFSRNSRCAFVRGRPGVPGMGRFMTVYHAMETGRDLTRAFNDRDSAFYFLGLARTRAAGSRAANSD